jgi:ABC-type multidrug transport system fused ATPase/permease subunit
MYNFAPMLIMKCIENREFFKKKEAVIQRKNLINGVVLACLSNLQEGVVYIFLVSLAVSGNITLGDFAMYLAATMAFTKAANNIISFTIGLNYTTKYIGDFTDFIYTADSLKKEGSTKIDDPNWTFEFKNVSYKYPFSDQFILKEINVRFGLGDRITLVGDNGAGKTTFVKLLMRFYDVTTGEILLNGKNINEYDYDEYFKMFSTVFQDYQLFAFTIAENIAFDEATAEDMEPQIIDALNKAGMLEKVSLLTEKMNSYLGKGFENDGIEFSGGEMQKIAIARSFYKDSPMSVLDEPTANLSPFAEYNIFKSFNNSTLDKTALFISHRLTSTLFCNRILVFDEGQIVEDGNHNELIKQGGLYKKMFLMQSAYYLNNEVNE